MLNERPPSEKRRIFNQSIRLIHLFILTLIMFAMVVYAAACRTSPTSPSSPAERSFTSSEDHVDAFLQLATDLNYDKLPRYYTDDTCYNITPDDVASKTGCILFKFSVSSAAFLQYHNQIHMLGESFGGYGLTDMMLEKLGDDHFIIHAATVSVPVANFSRLSLSRREKLAEVLVENGQIVVIE